MITSWDMRWEEEGGGWKMALFLRLGSLHWVITWKHGKPASSWITRKMFDLCRVKFGGELISIRKCWAVSLREFDKQSPEIWSLISWDPGPRGICTQMWIPPSSSDPTSHNQSRCKCPEIKMQSDHCIIRVNCLTCSYSSLIILGSSCLWNHIMYLVWNLQLCFLRALAARYCALVPSM